MVVAVVVVLKYCTISYSRSSSSITVVVNVIYCSIYTRYRLQLLQGGLHAVKVQQEEPETL